ncbi:MAG: OadG family protein [Christensenellales bacterium]
MITLTIPQALSAALFCMIAVFMVLILLWALMRLFSALIRSLEKHITPSRKT